MMGSAKIPEKIAERAADNKFVTGADYNKPSSLTAIKYAHMASELAKLRVENEKLMSGEFVNELRIVGRNLFDKVKALEIKNDTLKKEIERLRKLLIDKSLGKDLHRDATPKRNSRKRSGNLTFGSGEMKNIKISGGLRSANKMKGPKTVKRKADSPLNATTKK